MSAPKIVLILGLATYASWARSRQNAPERNPRTGILAPPDDSTG
jgi:hypothetical protein